MILKVFPPSILPKISTLIGEGVLPDEDSSTFTLTQPKTNRQIDVKRMIFFIIKSLIKDHTTTEG